jgi:hypothetical protein
LSLQPYCGVGEPFIDVIVADIQRWALQPQLHLLYALKRLVVQGLGLLADARGNERNQTAEKPKSCKDRSETR